VAWKGRFALRIHKKERVRDRWQIALYIPRGMYRQLRAEAHARDRGFGPTVIEILREHFARKAKPVASIPTTE
jgi:hypothetical protein